MQQKTFGMVAVLCAALMWAIEPVLTKLAYHQANFLQTSMVRAFVISIFSILLILITKKSPIIRDKQKFTALFSITILGTLGADLIYYYALTSIPIVNAVILAHLQPIFIILMGFLLLKTDTLHAYDYSGIFILILSGVLVTSGTIDRMIHLNFGTMGDAFVLIATFTWAITALITRKYLTHLDASVITFYRFFLASLVFVFLIPFVQLQPNIYQVIVGVVVGVGTISYYAGLKRLKAAQVSGLELAAPVFASVIGYCVLHEPITLLQGIGILLLFLGIFFISRKETHGFVT